MANNRSTVKYTLELFYNRNEIETPEGSTIGEIVRGLNVTQFVVMLNGEYVPNSMYDSVKINEGDELKLLSTLMAGG